MFTTELNSRDTINIIFLAGTTIKSNLTATELQHEKPGLGPFYASDSIKTRTNQQ